MTQSRMAGADFLASIAFLALGVYVVAEGLAMPGAGGFIEKGGEPGRVPILLGAIIAILGLVLLVRSVRAGGHRLAQRPAQGDEGRSGRMRSAITAAGCAFYALGLVGARIGGWHIPYGLATAAFVFAFIVIAEWGRARETARRRWLWLNTRAPAVARGLETLGGAAPTGAWPFIWLCVSAALTAIAVSAVVTIVFQRYFYVTLP